MRVDDDFLDIMRQQGDAAADELINQLFNNNLQQEFYGLLKSADEAIAKRTDTSPLIEFLQTPKPNPAWYDAERVKRGQRFFTKYALDIMTLLGAKSLPYCYAATPGNKAILLTEKMKKIPGKRLLETAHFIITVLKEGNFETGIAAVQINKTRLVHAMVRYYLKLKGSWNIAWGVPVNQEDMAGTNLAFSYIILTGLEQSKYHIMPEEKEDFLYAWRYIGYQLNIEEALLPRSYTEATILEARIRFRNIRQSSEGKVLMDELLKHYKTSFPAIAGYLVDAQIRYYVGDDVAYILGLRENRFKDVVIRGMNSMKESLNKRFVNPYAYEIMLQNHEVLKRRFS